MALRKNLSENYAQSENKGAHELISYILSQRQLCDLELILNGGFSPLTTFLDKKNYESVVENMRLCSGEVWPIPIMLDMDAAFIDSLVLNQNIALRDPEGLLIAILTFKEAFKADKEKEALLVYGTRNEVHPGVYHLIHNTKEYYVSGALTAISEPHHYDFSYLRHTPSQLREIFDKKGWDKIIAFQTRNPMHRAHQELTRRAAFETGGNILIHPVVGMTKPGDIEYYLRVKCYEHVLKTYPEGVAMLSLLPLAMRMAGPREALWHAIIRKNYGATHFIVGRDHAGPGKDQYDVPFYEPYAAQYLAKQYEKEIDINIIPFQEMFYSHKKGCYFPANEFPQDENPGVISGTTLRKLVQENQEIPEWFSFPSVIAELRKAYPPKHQQGITLFFTGLPSSGKSTLANALSITLRELTNRPVTLLDGDIIRTHLSKGLGFSEEDRETNITRVGFVAKEITKHGGICICALVAPFKKARENVRRMVKEAGGFLEIYVATPLDICETRDRKGLYKKAREGLIQQFTGISDPYEEPLNPEITIDTSDKSPKEVLDQLIAEIKNLGYLKE